MRRFISIISLIMIFTDGALFCQNNDQLTNKAIIKMVKAKLSDELIIYEISNSNVNFNLSSDSVQFLKSQNVSETLLQSMREMNESQHPESANIKTVADSIVDVGISTSKQELLNDTDIQDKHRLDAAVTVKPDPILPPAEQKTISKQSLTNTPSPIFVDVEKSTEENKAIGYAVYLNNLVIFFKDRSDYYTNIVKSWNEQMSDSISQINILNQKMEKIESEILSLENADSKAFSGDILSLKTQLNACRYLFKRLKMNVQLFGTKITQQLETFSKEDIRLTDDKFNTVIQQIKNAEPAPEANNQYVVINYPVQTINLQTLNYILPATTIIYWYRNKGISLKEVVKTSSDKVAQINLKDAALVEQLTQSKKDIETFKSDAKKNKTKISALKKNCDSIEKQRKIFAKQMETDRKQLSAYLKQMRLEVQNILKERYNDMIENINYMYQTKLNL